MVVVVQKRRNPRKELALGGAVIKPLPEHAACAAIAGKCRVCAHGSER